MSLIRYHQSGCHIERRGLTSTIRSQQTYNLTLLHIDGNVAYNGSFTVLLNQVFRAEHHLAFFHILVILRQM